MQLVNVDVVCIGDSLTAATAPVSNTQGAYRRHLVPLLNSLAAYDVRLIGTQLDPDPSLPPWLGGHEGYGGRYLQQAIDDMPRLLADNLIADVALILLGTNDLMNGATYMNPAFRLAAPGRMQSLLDLMHSINPNLWKIVATIPDGQITGQDTYQWVFDYNWALRSIITRQRLQGRKVLQANLWKCFPDSCLVLDGVHMNYTGYQLMADRWFEALKQVLPYVEAV
jgi:lysophospholipase L1-like esterase